MITFYQFHVGRILSFIALLLFSSSLFAQEIFAPEGINMPGAWNGWTNPPATNSPLGNENQVTGGGIKKLTNGTTRWKTTFTGLSGGAFVFSSGPSGSPYNNTWKGTTVTMNTLQTYSFNSGGDNSITCDPAKYYTMIWKDNGYNNTQAIFMETSASPVTIASISQNPTAGNVTPSDNVLVTVNLSASKSAEEKVYVKYTIDNFANCTVVQATGSGTTYTASIPSQADGTTIQYYAFTSTVSTFPFANEHDILSLDKSSTQSYSSASVPPVNISFRVDMQNETVAGAGVFVAGSFNGWNSTANPLTLISGTTYGTTVSMAQGSSIEFKFINGTSWESGLSGGCVNGSGNRIYTVGSSDATISSSCFNKCATCISKVATTFRVNMAGLTISGNGVHIAGDFGSNYPQWDPSALALTNQGGGIYARTFLLDPGQVVPFKFINGNAWGSDEGVPGACNSGGNRSYTVPVSASTTPLVCFGTCGTCITVTFQVDMTGETVSGNGVHVAGAFQGWNPGSTQLANIGGNIYARTVLVDPNYSSDYKFINGNSWGNDEGVANVCSPNTNGNRNFTIGTTSKTLPVVCFRQCQSCTSNITWLGGNGNFSDGNNWSSGWAPSSGCRTVVINNSANNPVISSGTFSLGNLSLNGGSGISVNSGANLNICGNVNGISGWIAGNGNLTFNGSSAQTINGYLTTSGTGSVIIDNANGVSLTTGAIMEVRNALKLQNGTFNVSAGNLIIGSDASNQGNLLKADAGASLTGNITYEKYLSGLTSTPNGAWYFVAPTTSGFALGGYDQGGNNMHPATFLPSNSDPGSLYTYSPNGGGFTESGWVKESSPSQTISAGQGLRVWARKVTSNSQFSYTGAPISGSINFPISFCNSSCSYAANGPTNGWNLLGNPYPCTIDWNAATGWTKNGIAGDAVYIWNANDEMYSTYNGIAGTNGGSRFIAGGQAFFINASSGSSSLSMTEDVKVNTNTSGLRVATEELSGLRINILSGTRKDEVFLDITPGHEAFSASKLDNPGLTLSLGQQNRYSIASLQSVGEGGIVPMNLRRNGNEFWFEIEKSGPQWALTNIYLRDEVNGQIFPLNDGLNTFNFVATGNETDRFSLIISDAVTSAAGKLESAFSVYPNPTSGKLNLRNISNQKGSYTISDLSGKVLSSGKLNGVLQSLNTESLSSGQYLIRFENYPEVIRFSKL